LGEDFQSAHPLWNAEVKIILEKYLEKQKTSDLKNLPQNNMIQRTLDYVSKLDNYGSEQNLSAAQELMKKDKKFTAFEAALINNLNISLADEAKTLIPSLADKWPDDNALSTTLNRLADYQQGDESYAMYGSEMIQSAVFGGFNADEDIQIVEPMNISSNIRSNNNNNNNYIPNNNNNNNIDDDDVQMQEMNSSASDHADNIVNMSSSSSHSDSSPHSYNDQSPLSPNFN